MSCLFNTAIPIPIQEIFINEYTNLSSEAQIRVFNALGATVYYSVIKEQDQQKINLSGIQKGLYFVKVSDDKEQFAKKMVVE